MSQTHAEWFKSVVCGLTHEEIAVACRNFGIDMRCGSCASVFYTGFGGYPHSPNCETIDAIKGQVADVLAV